MTYFDDDLDDDEYRRTAIIRRARTEGIEVAYESALEICRDPKAPKQAKSMASRTLLQIGGLFEKYDGSFQKDASEMTAEEMSAVAAAAIRRLKMLTSRSEDGDGIFG